MTTNRLYTRSGRYYADLRDYADEGGRQEALKPAGSSRATKDGDEALVLLAARLEELDAIRRGRQDRRGAPTLARAAVEYLGFLQTRDTPPSERWLVQVHRHLEVAADHFGDGRDVTTIGPADLRRYATDLRKRDNGRGGTLSGGTVRKYLNTLSGMYSLLLAEYRGVVTENPVELMPEKPTDRSAGTVAPLPPNEVALLLHTSLAMREEELPRGATPYLAEVVHVAALTGARWSEIAGLRVEDVDLERGGVRIEPNDWRGLKTKRAARTVPIWPQLMDVLRPHVERRRQEGGDLLFPSPSEGPETMLDNVRRQLQTLGERAGLPKRDPDNDAHLYLRWHRLRHAYTAQRLQTTERGFSVAPYTVAREIGHASEDMIVDRYGHAVERGENPDVVEFRVEHFADELPSSDDGQEAA